MTEELIFTILRYNFGVILLLFLIKTIHFMMIDSKRKTLKKFLYYSETNISGTKDPKKKKQKAFQNTMTMVLVSLLLLQMFILLSGAFFRRKIEE